LTANVVLPGGSDITVRHNTQKIHTTLKQNTAHKATQTIKDTLDAMTTKKKVKLSRLCGEVVRVPGYIFRGPGSILGASSYSEK
jgi:hypothetical protein